MKVARIRLLRVLAFIFALLMILLTGVFVGDFFEGESIPPWVTLAVAVFGGTLCAITYPPLMESFKDSQKKKDGSEN